MMVLRSGIIIPFQFRDTKKLLMIGVPEENRDLSIWDLKNVVRAAFGIYNFEFRNKKIGFNIPDELLLNYLAQRHDLTNFVIEVGQAIEDATNECRSKNIKESPTTKEQRSSNSTTTSITTATYNGHENAPAQAPENKLELLRRVSVSEQPLSYEPSCSQPLLVAVPQKSNESCNDTASNKSLQLSTKKIPMNQHAYEPELPPPPQKLRIMQVYSENTTPETMTQSIDPMDIMPKPEDQDECEMDMRNFRYETRASHMQPPFYPNFEMQMQRGVGHNMKPSSFSPGYNNRCRRRGERMSKDQKELYVKYFEENTCMLTQRRSDIMLEPHWQKLCSMLNSVPQGAQKNVEEWKQTFDAWRYRVFMYTRYNSKLTGAAAQNPKNYKPLTATDQRAYVMWTSHKNTAPHDYEKMDVFAQLDDSQADFDY